MVEDEKIRKKIIKAVEEEGAELRYAFVVYLEKDKLSYLAHVNKGELHTVVGMLERAKTQLIKRIEDASR